MEVVRHETGERVRGRRWRKGVTSPSPPSSLQQWDRERATERMSSEESDPLSSTSPYSSTRSSDIRSFSKK